MPSTVKPTPIALVVCDNIYHEPSGKVALVGLFNNIATDQMPAKLHRMAIFASLTDLRDGSTAKLEIVHGENDRIIVAAQGPFPKGYTPLTVIDMNFIFNNVTFPDVGTYFIRFWANDHLLLMRPFEVAVTKKKGEPKNDNN